MADAIEGRLRLEELLADALRPIEPPEHLSGRLEEILRTSAGRSAPEISSRTGELPEGELRALRDPPNWLRPMVAISIGSAAAAGLALAVDLRRRSPRQRGLRGGAERLLCQIGRRTAHVTAELARK